MSIRIIADGVDKALAEMEGTLSALGGKGADRAIANALNQSLSQARKTAAREARKAYTAPVQKLFENIAVKRAKAGNLEGVLDFYGKRGVSLIHFQARPDSPGSHPPGGISAKIKRKGVRKDRFSKIAGRSKSFIMKKKQGGFGVFVRYKGTDKGGKPKDMFEMLMGPSPIQYLQRRDAQAAIAETVNETFPARLNKEIDKLVQKLAGGK